MYYTPGQDCLGDVVHHYSHLMVSYDGFICWFHLLVLNHKMVSNKMVSQSKNGFPKDGFSIKKWFPKIWFLNHHMVPLYGFSIIIWYPKIWFLNQNLVNYMFPNQTSAFSRYSATDSSKCISATDSSCFRTIIECITSYD